MLVLYTSLPDEHIQFRALLVAPMKTMSVIIVSRLVFNIRKLVLQPEALTIDTLITPHHAGGMVFGSVHTTSENEDRLDLELDPACRNVS